MSFFVLSFIFELHTTVILTGYSNAAIVWNTSHCGYTSSVFWWALWMQLNTCSLSLYMVGYYKNTRAEKHIKPKHLHWFQIRNQSLICISIISGNATTCIAYEALSYLNSILLPCTPNLKPEIHQHDKTVQIRKNCIAKVGRKQVFDRHFFQMKSSGPVFCLKQELFFFYLKERNAQSRCDICVKGEFTHPPRHR